MEKRKPNRWKLSKPKYTVKATPGLEEIWCFPKTGGRFYMPMKHEWMKGDLWAGWNEGGSMVTRLNHKNGLQHGDNYKWYPSGKIKNHWQFKYGKLHGRRTDWYENGVTECQVHFREGQEHGPAWCWYKNGRLCDYAENWEGRLVELKVWKPDGSVCKESQICNGDGVWVVYNEDGTEKYRDHFLGGDLVSPKPG